MSTHIYLSPSAERFCVDIENARYIAKAPSIFYSTLSRREKVNEICIMRRWNSHTPHIVDVLGGGGYYIRWNNIGTIVDPGCSFIRLLNSETPYKIGDIQMMIVTHDHIDHCQDFGTLITLFREYNKWLITQNKPPQTWDLLMSIGVENQTNSLLVNSENIPFLRWSRVFPNESIIQVQPPPSISKNRSVKEMEGWSNHILTYTTFHQETIEENYQYILKILPACHKELIGTRSAVGLQFELLPSKRVIVISGDTSFNEDLDLPDIYQKANLLVLHVGTMEDPTGKKLDEHLGLDGIVKILFELEKKGALFLVILTEWGYEFGRIPANGKLGGRSRFTQLVVERLNDMGCTAYFAAVTPHRTDGKIPIIPADIGLRISLPDFNIWAIEEDVNNGSFLPPSDIWADERIEEIHYRPCA
jgi:ribonuclease BN (tRNA processing enzyme)